MQALDYAAACQPPLARVASKVVYRRSWWLCRTSLCFTHTGRVWWRLTSQVLLLQQVDTGKLMCLQCLG